MKVPVVGITIDERFLMHRLRSTSMGGLAAILVAGVLFLYHLIGRDTIRWDLFAILATGALVKIAVLIYYRITE